MPIKPQSRALALPFTRRNIQKQPAPSLPLSFAAKIQARQGKHIALPFTRLNLRKQGAKNLPLPFGLGDEIITPMMPITPSPPSPPKPKKRNPPFADFASAYAPDTHQGACVQAAFASKPHRAEWGVLCQPLPHLASCHATKWRYLTALQNAHRASWQSSLHLAQCASLSYRAVPAIRQSQAVNFGRNVALADCVSTQYRANVLVQNAVHNAWQNGNRVGVCVQAAFVGKPHRADRSVCWSANRAIPCEWYPLPITPPAPKPIARPCGDKPVSNRIPLMFARRKLPTSARMLPLPFRCTNDAVSIPPLDSYMIKNEISAQAGDVALHPLSASFRADMNGYCWTGEITLSPDDFIVLNMDSTTAGNERLITVSINSQTFVFMAENYRDNRQFGQRSYTVSGRSQTAKLGADYAKHKTGAINSDLYARQIADQTLQDLGFAIDQWAIVDWLIPAGTYSQTDKTPVAVLQDLAQAAGGFVYSHPSEPQLAIKPRWRVPAWELAQTSPAVTVPANVMLSASGQKQTNAQAMGVFVWGTSASGKAANVYRAQSAGEPRAAAVQHVLLTDLDVCQAAGIAALSDTGAHKTETIVLPFALRYGLGLAELGRVWRFEEPQGAFNGIITGVAVQAAWSGDAPAVKQTLTVERYLGD